MRVPTIMYGFLLVGICVGMCLYRAWLRAQRRRRKRLPNRWDLAPRGLVTVEEFAVWRWLEQAFHEYRIAVKTPVARFARARDRGENRLWFSRLDGIFCTFCICTPEGLVIGCVDVPGKMGLLRSSREMKENILTACGLGYAVIRGDKLPDRAAIRAAFLGEIPPDGPLEEDSLPYPLDQPTPASFSHLELLTNAPLDFDPLRTDTGITDSAPDWHDSFLGSSESRPAALSRN